MKKAFLPLFLLGSVSLAIANTAPTVIIQSAEMRPGTTLMDVVYRVNDPDDATVKTRALAFVDGVRSFANVIRPVTFVEGTAANLGDAIPANVDHTLTWDVAADWDIDLGQVKFEVLAMDGRGLLPFDWITIPAAGGNPELTISKNSPLDTEVIDALFWQFASSDERLNLAGGTLTGNENSGVFHGRVLAEDVTLSLGGSFVLKTMNLAKMRTIDYSETNYRADIDSPMLLHALNSPWIGINVIEGWGNIAPLNTTSLDAEAEFWDIAAGGGSAVALMGEGTALRLKGGTLPQGLTDVVSIAVRAVSGLAVKADGTVTGWGSDNDGQISGPSGMSNVSSVALGSRHSLILKNDGTVEAFGIDDYGQISIPEGLSNVVAIAATGYGNVALKSDGTIVHWGQQSPPQGLDLTNIAEVVGGQSFFLALKKNGTVVGWGMNAYGQTTIPINLSNVIAITAGNNHSLALKNDGTVVAWGNNEQGQCDIPEGLIGITKIAAGQGFSMALGLRY